MKSGCALDGHLTLEQLTNYEFQCTQDKRNLLAGMLHLQKADRNFLQVDTSSQILRRQRVCEAISLFDGDLSKMHDANVHVFLDSVSCMGKGAVNEPVVKFTKRRTDYLEKNMECERRLDGEKIQFIFHILSWQKDERDRGRDR